MEGQILDWDTLGFKENISDKLQHTKAIWSPLLHKNEEKTVKEDHKYKTLVSKASLKSTKWPCDFE